MSYTQHLLFSANLSVHLLYGAYAAFLHALVPSWFTSSTTRTVDSLRQKLSRARMQPLRARL